VKKKNLRGKLTLNQQTVANLTRDTMENIYGRTGEACESMVLSCDPKKYLCETSEMMIDN